MLKPNLIIEETFLKVRNNLLTLNEQRTSLTADATAGGSTLTVENISGFSINDYLIIGAIGSEQTELVRVHGSTAPTGTTITLSASITYSHSRDTYVQRVAYNQAIFEHATTAGGSKTTLATVSLQVDQEFTIYNDTVNSTGYCYVHFSNSTAGTNSETSDEQAYGNLAFNSIARIINRMYSKANERTESFVKRQEVLDWVWDFIDDLNDLRTKWKYEESSTNSSNSTTQGGDTFTLPTDIKFDGDKSILAVYIGGTEPLKTISQQQFIEKNAGLARSSVASTITLADTNIVLTDATLFPDSGTGYIAGDEFTWTAKSGNTLTGVSGVLGHAAGTIAFDQGSLGTPAYYTILNGTGYLQPAPDADSDNRVLYIDYYARVTYPDSENDLLPMPYVAACGSYLLQCLYDKKEDANNSARYGQRFDKQILTAIRSERMGQPQFFKVKE